MNAWLTLACGLGFIMTAAAIAVLGHLYLTLRKQVEVAIEGGKVRGEDRRHDYARLTKRLERLDARVKALEKPAGTRQRDLR